MIPATHFSAPECEKEKGKPDRPPDDEAEHRDDDPAGVPGRIEHMGPVVFFGGAAPSIDICGVGHFPLHHGLAVVNVNNIYIRKPSRIFVKLAARPHRQIISVGPTAPRTDPMPVPRTFDRQQWGRLTGDRSENPILANRSALRLPEAPPPTWATCA